MLPWTLLYCTKNVAGIHVCIRGRGQGSLDPPPPENRRNIVFPCNAGPDPLKNHKVANPSAKTSCPSPISIEA